MRFGGIKFTYRAIWFLESHEVHDQSGRPNEENLHKGVVDADKVHEKVHVSHAENNKVDFLSFNRETYTFKHKKWLDIYSESKIIEFLRIYI